MWLSPTQIAAANHALRDLIARRTLGGQPIRQVITDLHEKLVAASAGGTQGASPQEELTTGDLIGTKDAAAILRCSTRRVRRIHVDGVEELRLHDLLTCLNKVLTSEHRQGNS